jgi:hypothetical protein
MPFNKQASKEKSDTGDREMQHFKLWLQDQRKKLTQVKHGLPSERPWIGSMPWMN